jgi:hypothetical protein
MSNDMRTHVFFLQRRRLLTGSLHCPLDESVDAKTGDGRAANIEEHPSLRWSLEAASQQSAQDLGGVRPQRAKPDLASLAQNPDKG